MVLDFIGVSASCGVKGDWLAAEEGLVGGNLTLAIGAIVRAMVARHPAALAGKAGDLRQQSAVATTSQ
ncbi:hypothetical protein DEU50_10480 [Aeromonas salmonicida]|uniref:Uncharacterized protein n=1 Tax=Aeromonas salmonicida TaxID=645 RepID=A0AAX1PKJ1_AERSA|nr:hypothetical protein DEU50_10480 [Aeromonas salmonicida]